MTQAFNLSQFANYVNSSGQASLTTAVTGILPIANGGTNATSLTSNAVLLGGTSVGSVTNGTTGYVLTSTGTTTAPTFQALPVSGQNLVLFNATGTWTVPTGVTKAIVWVYGNGGTGQYSNPNKAFGGFGGYALAYITTLTPAAVISITVTSAGSGSNSTSFGSYVSASGGTNSPGGTAGTSGTGTVTTGTAIVTGNCGTTAAGTFISDNFVVYNSYFIRPGILNGTDYGRAGFGYGVSASYPAGQGAVAIQY